MASPRLRHIPSVRIVLLVVGFALLAPLVVIGRTNWQTADDLFVAAHAASEHSDHLEVLLQLAPAIAIERNAAASMAGAQEVGEVLPAEALDEMGFDFAADTAEARAQVDGLIAAAEAGVGAEEADIDEFRTLLTATRGDLDRARLSFIDAVVRYDEIREALDDSIQDEVSGLVVAADAAGAPALDSAVHVGEASTDLQVASGSRFVRWLRVRAPFFDDPVEDVRALADSLTLVETYRSELDHLVAEGDSTAELWASLRVSENAAELDRLYAATVRSSIAAEVAPPTELVELSTIDPVFLLTLAADVESLQDIAAAEADEISGLAQAAIDDIAVAADAALSHAEGVRLRTAAVVGGFALLLLTAALIVLVLVIRPVAAMAETALALRGGRLDKRMAEAGPKELRVAAHAMNEAITALETAEAQAVALAEERLDDPVLSKPSIGRLGESLQSAVAHLATSLNEREGFQRRLAHEASHDGLTKLPNRNAVLVSLEAAMARTRRSSASLALLFIDIDDFKMINDVHGHQAGDTVLRTISHRLTAAVRQGDLAGRLGGDEFVVIAEPVENIDDALLLSERVLSDVCQPIECDGVTITPSISIGIGIATGDDLSADELLRDADLAVYRAKSLGKGRVDVCDEALRSEMTERTTLEQSIQSAITNDELMLQFQPVMDTATERVTSLEALVRWRRADGTLLPPDDFIPIAERTDLIIELDRWVLRTVALQLQRWTDHPTLGSLPVAVNISARHLASGLLADHVQQVLGDHGVDPTRVVLELTETALLCDIGGAAHELGKLRHTGVRIALDDFGTGYMSLSHLRGLPVDVIKIDRSFVSKIESGAERSLIKLIVDTGHVLGAAVTAEGVETNSQAEVLAEFGSDHLQGYLYSKPIDAELIERWIQDNTQTRAFVD